MKKIYLSFLALSFLLVACDDGPKTTGAQPSNESPAENLRKSKTESHDHAHHSHHADMDDDIPGVPVVPTNASVFFANLENGAQVPSSFYVEFGTKGMEVEPAGMVNEGKGHHHLIIDGSFMKTGGTVPADENNIHYGKGQTGDSLSLSAGKHTLTMQFADGLHRSYGEQMSTTIEIEVVE